MIRLPARIWLLLVGAALLTSGPAQLRVSAQEAEAPEPITTADPQIPVDQLKLLVNPLTMEELVVEADGWRDLVKEKATQISLAEIASRRKTEEIKAEEEGEEPAAAPSQAQEAGEAPTEEGEAELDEEVESAIEETEEEAVTAQEEKEAEEGAAPPAAEEEAAEPAAEEKEVKTALLENLTQLREEKTALVDRLNVVLDELEEKGGDPEEYRTYIKAASGIQVEVTEPNAVWTAISGWITSKEGGVKWALNLAKFFGILLAFYILSRIVGRIVHEATARTDRLSDLMEDFLNRVIPKTIMFLGLIAALPALGINVGALMAMVGAGAFIIGFAFQDSLSNLVSGLMLLAYRPFDIGDSVDVAGISGTVDSLNLGSTRILTDDNQLIIVPNQKVWGDIITNATGTPQRRVDMNFKVSYESDLGKALEILERVVSEHPLILEEPEPVIQVSELGESSVTLICRPWVKTGDYGTVQTDIINKVREEFEANGLSIPATS